MSVQAVKEPSTLREITHNRQNELSTLVELMRNQDILHIYSKTTGDRFFGPIVWFDIQNIAIRTDDGFTRVIAKENIDYWTYFA